MAMRQPAWFRLKPADDPAPDPKVKLPRQPRPDEALEEYICAISKTLGLIDQAASLSATRKTTLSEELIARATDDELFGGSRTGQAILAAVDVWQKANPTISDELGSLRERSHDLAGRAVRGVPRAVAALLERLVAYPADVESLTEVEREILRSQLPELASAVDELAHQREHRLKRIVAMARTAQEKYPPGEPGRAVVRESAEASP
jgi:hypothetical protein